LSLARDERRRAGGIRTGEDMIMANANDGKRSATSNAHIAGATRRTKSANNKGVSEKPRPKL
jgi:hypothetical protein